eukprot:16449745-Heterocapsa_arctica.AAC.1
MAPILRSAASGTGCLITLLRAALEPPFKHRWGSVAGNIALAPLPLYEGGDLLPSARCLTFSSSWLPAAERQPVHRA